jgi:membrane protein
MARSQTTDSSAPDDAPNSPTDLSGGSWLAAARRALKEYKADDLQDRAAALTYFGIQSIFPGLLVLVSLLGILGKSAAQPPTGTQRQAFDLIGVPIPLTLR